MSQFRVLHIISSLAIEGPLGGVARYAVDLCRAFDKNQVAPAIVGLWDYHTGFERQRCVEMGQEGIPAFITADWDETAPYLSCIRAIQGFYGADIGPVDVIHSHGEFSDLAALFLRRRLAAKAMVRTVHNEIEWSKRPIYGRIFTNLLYPFVFDAELGVSQQVTDKLNRRPLQQLRGRKAQVMYNALDFARFAHGQIDRNTKLESLAIPPDATVVGTVGRLTRQKAYDVLLDAVPLVLQQHPNAVFVIIGDGPLRPQLEEQLHQLGVGHAVRFTGPRKDIEELMELMDLFVSSSRWEGLPTVLLESIAAGVPIVATAVSGTVELVQDEANGILVPPEDAQTLAAAILKVIADPEPYRQGVKRVYSQIKERFSLKTVANQHIGLYRELLAKKER